MTSQAIFGGFGTKGKLPVSTKHYALNYGIETNKIRLEYSIPEEFGVNESDLYKIDSLAKNAISEESTPGCQILIAKESKIIFNKSYGYHTYSNKKKVDNSDIYDLASVTKISATIPLLMKMVDDGKLNIGLI